MQFIGIGKAGFEPAASRVMHSPLFHLSYIPLCFSDRPSVIWIRINHFPWDKFSRIIDRLHANSVILTELKRNFQSRTGKLVSIDICPIADRFHITRKTRVSNMFIVLCFPLGCFMPCQSHGVVSDLGIHLLCLSLENFLSSMRAYRRQFNSETVPNGESSPSNRLCRYTPFTEIIHIHSFGSFFCLLNG